MKKFDITAILFGLLLSAVALYFMLKPAASQAAPSSSIATVQIGNLAWDQTEMTIADVKGFANATGFTSQAEKNGGGLSYEAGFVKKPGWTWKTPYGVPAKDAEPAVHLNQKEAESVDQHLKDARTALTAWYKATKKKVPQGAEQLGQVAHDVADAGIRAFKEGRKLVNEAADAAEKSLKKVAKKEAAKVKKATVKKPAVKNVTVKKVVARKAIAAS